ncbi:MAG: lysophospholipase [Legionella sp.]|nr:MAG: lysophospholipase [Legionella sp.]PJD98411.1 MAG: lysophospholipase [Legionella sp.]
MRLLFTLGACFLSGFLCAAPLHNIVVFGDSLSDNGNLYELMQRQFPQSPPYYDGRFSNGPVWVEQIASSYFPDQVDTRLLDYAVGGSGVAEDDEDDVLLTLKKQINNYLLSHHDAADPNDLYIVWIGANNYLGMPEDTEATLREVTDGIVHGLERLADKGAKHIVLFNLPNLGKTPAASEFDSEESMSYLSLTHNERLSQSFMSLKEKYPHVEWFYFDAGAVFTEVIDHPDTYNFVDVSHPCSTTMVNNSMKRSVLKMAAAVTPMKQNDSCDGYLFFDLVHPTVFAHKVIAEKVHHFFDEAGVSFSK